MGFTLDKVVPWGRSYNEYVSMFALSEADLKLPILGCGDGPAEFNSILTNVALALSQLIQFTLLMPHRLEAVSLRLTKL